MEPRRQPGAKHTYSVMPQYMYRLTDVKVGDEVGIIYARVNGIDICDHIRLCRRPDGLVPPLPKEAEDLMRLDSVVERFKAKNPGRPLPDWMEKLPRYVPYHEWVNTYWDKVAPMPREVKPIGPRISQ